MVEVGISTVWGDFRSTASAGGVAERGRTRVGTTVTAAADKGREGSPGVEGRRFGGGAPVVEPDETASLPSCFWSRESCDDEISDVLVAG